jgi:hypothetical protein
MEGNGIERHPRAVAGRFIAVAIGATLLAACGGEAASMPAPPTRVEGLRSPSAVEQIELEELTSEAVDAKPLADLLESAGFRSAVERTYAGSSPAIRRVVVRIVRFDSTSGADRYLGWLREHVSDVIGDAELATEHPFRDAPVYVHQPTGCCAKEPVVALAVWRRATDVVRVLIAGPDADGQTGTTMLHAFAGSFPPSS